MMVMTSTDYVDGDFDGEGDDEVGDDAGGYEKEDVGDGT